MDSIIDSDVTPAEIFKQNPEFVCPQDIIAKLDIIEVKYYSFDERVHAGQIVVHKEIIEDVKELFHLILQKKFPITSVIPISDKRFFWNDELSMQANNTSGFNYRKIARTNKLSFHAYGRAIDINPKLNPFIKGDFVQPKAAVYDKTLLGTITQDSFIVTFLKDRGWE